MSVVAAEWETFGDFADDAFLGLLLFFFIPLAIFVWWANRKGGSGHDDA